MTRGIDHLVLCVHDLERARKTYEALGFTMTPIAHHDWGTANSLAQFDGCFLEVLTVAEPGKIPTPASGEFGFGAFNRDFLARREGFSMLVFEGHDARADRDEFAAKGLSDYAPFDFSRRARLPDGNEATVAFSLAFVTHPAMPEAAFFTCQQHAPEYFWKPDYQRHGNGARTISEVIMAAPEPEELAGFYESLVGPGSVGRADDGLSIATPRGRITVATPERLAVRFPAAAVAEAPVSPHFVGFRIEVPDMTPVEKLAAKAERALHGSGSERYLLPSDAYGLTIAFGTPSAP